MLSFDQLQIAVAAAKRRFDLIRKKYPGLKAYLVMSLPGGQTGIDSAPTQILSEFPAMVVDDNAKTSALDLLSRIEKSGVASRNRTRNRTGEGTVGSACLPAQIR